MKQNQLNKYSFGVGDRFAHQAKAQLNAVQMADEQGVKITPVWNKSFREHTIIKSKPIQTREAADEAVKELQWQNSYFLDADHINLETVDHFIDCSDFFTLDVADYIGKNASENEIEDFVTKQAKYTGKLKLKGTSNSFEITNDLLSQIAGKYLFAVKEAGKIYRHILQKKQNPNIVIEVSMDEIDSPQTPVELLFILAALSDEQIPLQTIAPKFSGRFNKGVDYVGDTDKFRQEFEEDLAVIQFAISEFSLPKDLKLSVHSGSDKFSIYPVINAAIKKFDTGVHLKTAGTTWLEELIGLAEAEGSGLVLAKEIYAKAFEKAEALCAPYASVIDIDTAKLPSPDEVNAWDGKKYAESLRHDQANANYNPNFRQLLHVGYKIAADLGDKYLNALEENEDIISKNVTENIFKRHIKPLFIE
ncbi:MAG: tagaturonate epimerase family protein [Calditrichaceae bacterium]